MADQSSITIIAALANPNRVIGHQGQLPWHLPEDLKRFKALTLGHPIIMGRKTWEFCLNKRTLPQRHSIVVSRSFTARENNDTVDRPSEVSTTVDGPTSLVQRTSRQMVRSLSHALTLARQCSESSATPSPRIFIIGGASIYTQTLSLAQRLELTLVHGSFDGDAFFPPYEHLLSEFDCVASLPQAHTTPPCTYVTYERRHVSQGCGSQHILSPRA